jgi:subtilisin family serine protease
MDSVREQLYFAPTGTTGAGVRVAVLDTGIDLTHPDFRGRVDEAASRSYTVLHDDLTDRCGHGTHVAGIIAGSGEGSGGRFRGLAPDATLLIYKVAAGTTWLETNAAAAIEAALDAGVDIINFSSGRRPSGAGNPPWIWPTDLSPLEDAFKEAAARGVLCVVAAGNEGVRTNGDRADSSITLPGGLADVLTVGSVDKNGGVTFTSGRGPFLRLSSLPRSGARQYEPLMDSSPISIPKPNLVAPGEEVIAARAAEGSAYGEGDLADPLQPSLAYVRMSGTSQAAAVVSGLAACLLELARANSVELTPNPGRVLHAILRFAAARRSTDNEDDVGHGRLKWPFLVSTFEDFVNDEQFRAVVLQGPQLRLYTATNGEGK